MGAQQAIERVYYAHQTGANRPFEEAVPRSLLETKVRKYLGQSAALEAFWKTPVTDEMLGRELQRMAAGTRLPGRLSELYAALGNDPFLIKECLARPVLVDRLSRNFFAFDATIHGAAREQAKEIRQQLVGEMLNPHRDHPMRTVVEFVMESGSKPLEHEKSRRQRMEESQPARLDLPPAEYRKNRARWPRIVGEISGLEEERDAFLIRSVLSETRNEMRVASYRIPKTPWDEWWQKVRGGLKTERIEPVALEGSIIPPPTLRSAAALESSLSATLSAPYPAVAGGPLCSSDNTWDNGTLDDLPDERVSHTVVWTGSLMVVWGGQYPEGNTYLNTGARYDPATDTWTQTSIANAPSGRTGHTAVMSDGLMVVWGGYDPNYLNTGGRYDPAADTWTPTSITNAPSSRFGHTAVWTGSLMVVWGGHQEPVPGWDGIFLNTGGVYDAATDTWRSTSTTNAPIGRLEHTAIWTGSLMVVWGGRYAEWEDTEIGTGGRYDPATDTWTSTSITNAPSARLGHTAVWTGSLMIVWGGPNGDGNHNTGGRYDPAADTWTPTSTTNAPIGRRSHAAIWTGTLMVLWGGLFTDSIDAPADLDSGGRYDPLTDTWMPTSTSNAPSARSGHTAVWTGSLMVVWGGAGRVSGSSSVNTGGRYDTATDAWTPTSTTNAPGARRGHAAIWTGTLMVVWGGGDFSGPLSSGGRYDPATDSWMPTSTTNAPTGGFGAATVWTGELLLTWGGSFAHDFFNAGGRYSPVADTWTPISTTNGPRLAHYGTAVWTGSLMLAWGGGPLIPGGRYDPATDTWTPISTTNAPVGRNGHTAIWTGSLMMVWGGLTSEPVNTGRRYDPATDTWTPTSTVDAPSPRNWHSAVWTGSRMVVWGGNDFDAWLNTGGQYDPATDTWTPTSTTDAPSARNLHTAVWTGSRMVTWGGRSPDTGSANTGGRYDPATNTWTPTSTTSAPGGRYDHTSVWTGSRMIVWGGSLLTTGGMLTLSDSSDRDADGFATCAGDCDDASLSIHPGAQELCNSVDDNCDGEVDEGYSIGTACTRDVDECHQLHGVETCLPDGLGTECEGTVVPHDVSPPSLAMNPSSALLWPPNHRMVDVSVAVTAVDACGPASVQLVSLTSSESDDAPGRGDGATLEDIQRAEIGAADLDFLLRAERDGSGEGRVYQMTYRAIDNFGNQTARSAIVFVPHVQDGVADPLLVSVENMETGTVLRWEPVPDASIYKIIRGTVASLREAEDFIDLGAVSCVQAGDAISTEGQEDTEIPPLGEAYFYLLAYDDGLDSGYGTDTADKPRAATGGGCD